MSGDLSAQGGPIHLAAAWDVDSDAAFLLKEVDGVLREEAARPFRAFIAGVGAALGREIGGGFVSVERDGFHGLVVEGQRFFGGEGDTFNVEGVGETHDAHADGAVAHVGGLGGLGGVKINVDDVVERANGHADGLAEFFVIE